MVIITRPDFFYLALRSSTSLFFAVLAVYVCDVSGIVNIAVEGMMLMSAFWGMAVSTWTNSSFLGVLGGILSSIMLSALFAALYLKLKANPIMIGLSMNLFSAGFTVLLLNAFAGSKGTSISMKSKVLPNLDIPVLKDIPILGDVLNNHNVLTYIALVLIPLMYFMVEKTKWGLRMRAVGESEEMARNLGVDVRKVKTFVILLSGFLSALGGVFLSMGYVSWFSKNMTGGRGFIALAIQAFGGRSVYLSSLLAFLFGMTEIVSYNLQVFGFSVEAVKMIPFVLTMLLLVIFSKIKSQNSL